MGHLFLILYIYGLLYGLKNKVMHLHCHLRSLLGSDIDANGLQRLNCSASPDHSRARLPPLMRHLTI